MNYKTTIQIRSRQLNLIEKMLDGTNKTEGITRMPHDGYFANGHMATIDVIRGKDDAKGRIEAKLFDEMGNEVSVLTTRGDILGEWAFRHDNDAYTVEVEEAPSAPDALKSAACPHPVH